MCIVIYIAGCSPLPLIQWQQDAPAFNVTELTQHDNLFVAASRHLTFVRLGAKRVAAYFNERREHPEVYDDLAAKRAGAMESSS